jgi:hypothetical protein
MGIELPTSAATTEELFAVYDDNAEPFRSLDQCDLFIRAASILLRRVPIESDQVGSRFKLNDVRADLETARRWRSSFLGAERRVRTVGFGGLE